MPLIRVQTQLKSRYPVFDASGHLPCDIVFGLRRKSDSDPRDISFQKPHSILDVSYALAKGLLEIHELRRPPPPGANRPEEHVEVDLSALRDAIDDDDGEPAATEFLTLPSRSNRTAKRGQLGVTEYRYRIEAGSALAACLEVGRKYSIGIAERDLGVHSWIDSSNHTPPSDTATATTTAQTSPAESTDDNNITETCNLRSNSHGGFAVFTVVKNLTWPPTLETRMHLLFLPDPSNPNPERPSSDQATLQITVTNPHPTTTTISLQTRGHQRFLGPWGPFQPESDDGLYPGRRPTILASPPEATANFQITNLATGAVVRDYPKPGACAGARTGKRPDLRPRVEDFVVLEPGVVHSREIGLGGLVRGLGDGRYVVRLKPKGCWWCFGEVGVSDPDGKVPRRVYGAKYQTPVVLRSDDEVEFVLRNGMIVQG
jgi:hypothetical protein